jgi:hypothetical protein
MSYLYIYVSYIIPLCIIIPIIIAFFKYRLLSFSFKVLLWFLIFSADANALNIILSGFHIFTTTLFHVFTVFEFAFITWFYSTVFDKKWRYILAILVTVFTIFCIINFFCIQTGVEVATYTGTLEAVIIIAYAILYLFKHNNNEQPTPWEQSGLNWVNISFLIYYGCGLFIFISANFLAHASQSVNLVVWSVFDTILLVQYLLFAVGFYKCST